VCLAAHNTEFPGWTPGNVKLFRSPGKAGGFPVLLIDIDQRDETEQDQDQRQGLAVLEEVKSGDELQAQPTGADYSERGR